ncbi:hypothetical protein E2C01_078040 [Portunus trituberculatus]|uniref:Uncharacterized protein n=1 Tax=Portunus trituberculatus TaxID=210409 RepID=A0A5B7IHP6_PORTR|nr:hypothetical protein [Portunus trituberculatus]
MCPSPTSRNGIRLLAPGRVWAARGGAGWGRSRLCRHMCVVLCTVRCPVPPRAALRHTRPGLATPRAAPPGGPAAPSGAVAFHCHTQAGRAVAGRGRHAAHTHGMPRCGQGGERRGGAATPQCALLPKIVKHCTFFFVWSTRGGAERGSAPSPAPAPPSAPRPALLRPAPPRPALRAPRAAPTPPSDASVGAPPLSLFSLTH